ncbi:hypothetical protein BD410DRAFT_788681 [Rickenella mellea]|uniref:F-box domain-containing protein n=1 Tax=Rickenella mellea TaxID=50990 RepID=A0A4Y7Q6F9_9AGAM|nr:hypothetical protein BD410DRAFT_788681 [Rickenella mellea]
MAGTTSTTIETLSPELLAEIFWHCVYDHPDKVSVPRWRSHAPLLLGRVCSRWRTISVSAPEIWSTIVIGGHGTKDKSVKYRKDIDAARVWVSRSGTCPLTFNINEWDPTNRAEEYGAELRQVLELVVSQFRRWSKILAVLPRPFMKMLLVPLIEGDTPKLEEFQSQSITSGDMGGFDPWSFVLSSTPHLKRLKVLCEPISIDFGDQIHHVQFIHIMPMRPLDAKPSLLDLLQCLIRCPSLTTLALQIGGCSPAATLRRSLPNVIALTDLHTLKLSFNATIDPYLVFDRLYLPSIKHIVLTMRQCTQADWPHLASMLERSHPPLETLNLYNVPMTERTLIECLSFTPKLVNLDVRGIHCSDLALASLTIDDNEGSNPAISWPYLTIVALGPPSLLSPNALKAMILSRWAGAKASDDNTVTPGKALQVVRCPSESVRDMLSDPDICHCITGGLTVEQE